MHGSKVPTVSGAHTRVHVCDALVDHSEHAAEVPDLFRIGTVILYCFTHSKLLSPGQK
jgi:hypothetical protein